MLLQDICRVRESCLTLMSTSPSKCLFLLLKQENKINHPYTNYFSAYEAFYNLPKTLVTADLEDLKVLTLMILSVDVLLFLFHICNY